MNDLTGIDDDERLAAVNRYLDLNLRSDRVLDEIVQLVARLTETPIALVSLVAADRIEFIARHGVEADHSDVIPGLCASTVQADGLRVVPDTLDDPTTAQHPLVLDGIRCYVGAPLVDVEGNRIGTLCVADPQPRHLTQLQLDTLSTFARVVTNEIEQRYQVQRLSGLEQQLQRAVDDRRREADRFWQLAESMPGLVWISQADGEMDYAGPALFEYAGLPVSAIDTEMWLGLIHPEDRAVLTAARIQARNDATQFSAEIRLRRHDGEYRWHLLVATPSTDDDGELVSWFGSAIDRHDAHMAEQQRANADKQLRRVNTMLTLASRLGRVGGWSVKLGDPTVGWSDMVCAIHEVEPGYRPSVETAVEYYADEHRPVITAAFEACINEGTPYDIEAEIITATGRRIWCRTIGEAERGEDGLIVRVAGALQDINVYKNSELALRQNEERFRLLSEATSDVVFDWDLVNSKVWWGEGLADLIGTDFSSYSVMNSGPAVLRQVHPADRERVNTGLNAVIRGDQEIWTEAMLLTHASGEPKAVEVNGYVIRDENGMAQRMVGSLVDMTAQRTLEDQLAQSQRLEAVGLLTGGIAHDFNNLLTVILGNSDLLLESLDSDPDLRELAEMTRLAAERGAALTQRLLAFARRQPLEPKVLDVRELLTGFRSLLRRTLGEDIELSVEHGPQLWPAVVDQSQLESAVLNICLNARDAMPAGGQLRIETVNVAVEHPHPELHDGLDAGQYVKLSISDTGSGMSQEVLERAFDPFFSTKSTGSGTGLGLSMVYGFAKQSRGHVLIQSALGEGTTVVLYLPRGEQHETVEIVRPTIAQLLGGDECILLVEDDDLVRELASAQLQGLGYTVVEAASGPEAVEILRFRTVDLIFTDIVMPGGMNGRELAEVASTLQPEAPVLFASGYSQDAVMHQGRLNPGIELLSKPYRLDDLAGRVRRLLDAAAGSESV